MGLKPLPESIFNVTKLFDAIDVYKPQWVMLKTDVIFNVYIYVWISLFQPRNSYFDIDKISSRSDIFSLSLKKYQFYIKILEEHVYKWKLVIIWDSY